MAKLGISTGTIPDDGTGDSLLDGAIKINSNFSELYTLLGDGTTLTSGIVTSIVAGSNITVSGSTGQVTVNADSPKNWETTAAGIHTLSNVGIGTTNPTSKLTVTGSGLFTGVVTATSFSGSGSNLTGIVTGITAGANITVLESPSGNFIITSTSSGSAGAGGTWATTSVGIHTLKNVGIGTTNPTSALTVKGNTSLETLNVSGVSTFKGSIFGDTIITDGSIYSTAGFSTFSINVARGVDFLYQSSGIGKLRISGDTGYGGGLLGFYDGSNNLKAAWDSNLSSGSIDIYNYINSGTQNITISAGSSVVLQHGGTNTKLQTLGTGVTITGTTFTNQLSVSGISTLGNTVVGGATTQLIVSGDARVTGILTVGTASITLNGITDTLTVPNLVVTNSTTGVTASGVGITVRDGGGDLGSAEVIDFGDNLTVSFASGIATVTGSAGGGGSSQWVTTSAGIHTLSNVGVGTTNPISALTVKGNTSLETLNVSGVSTFSGITNVTGSTLFTKQLNVSGVSTLGASTVFTTVDNLGNIGIGTNVAINEYSEGNSILSIHGRTWPGNPTLAGSGHLRIYSNKALLGSIYGQDLTGIGFGSSFIIDSSVPMYIGSASTVFINVSGGFVGIATENPMAQLQVDRFGTQTGFGTFSASVGVSTTIDTFTKSFLTAEYTVHIGYGTYIQAQKVLVMNNGSTAYSQEYAIMYEPSQIVSVGTTVSGANVLLQVTPQTGVTGLTTYRFVRNSLI